MLNNLTAFGKDPSLHFDEDHVSSLALVAPHWWSDMMFMFALLLMLPIQAFAFLWAAEKRGGNY